MTNFDLLKGTFDEIVKDFGGIHGLYARSREPASNEKVRLCSII